MGTEAQMEWVYEFLKIDYGLMANWGRDKGTYVLRFRNKEAFKTLYQVIYTTEPRYCMGRKRKLLFEGGGLF